VVGGISHRYNILISIYLYWAATSTELGEKAEEGPHPYFVPPALILKIIFYLKID
jgi:hypothetical protein